MLRKEIRFDPFTPSVVRRRLMKRLLGVRDLPYKGGPNK